MRLPKPYCLIRALIIVSFLQSTACQDNPDNGYAGKGSPGNDQSVLTKVQLQKDFRQLREFIEESHPQLHRFTSEHSFDSICQVQYGKIDTSMTVQQFYQVLAPVIAAIGCGHTSIWSPRGYWDSAPDRMFPLGIYAMDGELFVIHHYGLNNGPPPGTRIKSVNGRPVEKLLAEMLANIWSDGMIKTKRFRRLNNVFPYLYALNYGFPEGFELLVEQEGTERSYQLEPVSRSVLSQHHEQKVREGIIPIRDLELKLIGEDIAWMRIRTFGWYDNVKGFHHFLDSSFQVLHSKSIDNLIIDLRGNDGGDPWCSSHLLRYLQEEPTVYFMYPYGSYAPLNRPLDMADEPYTGRQFYLIDGMCFSTTGHLTSLLKYHKLGIFIGEETGATYTCNDASHETTLENSGYIVRSARRSFAAAVKNFPLDQGIMPDYEVKQSVSDVIENKDVVLAFALDLIAGLK